jgi:hypothetical protein
VKNTADVMLQNPEGNRLDNVWITPVTLLDILFLLNDSIYQLKNKLIVEH